MNLVSEVARNGYAFVERFMPPTPTLEILRLLGTATTLPGGQTVYRLVPQGCGPPNTYSGMFGYNAFPLHTDLAHWHWPPRYIVLRCLQGFDAVTTLIMDGHQVVSSVGKDVLSRALVQPRRPLNGKLPLLKLYQRDRESSGLLRWDETFIRPVTPAGHLGVCKLREFLAETLYTQVRLSDPSDTLIVDNWRMLHGRSAIPNECASRIIERAYLETLR